MNIRDILPVPTEDQKAFILDHGKTIDDGLLKYQDDMTSYGWNVKRFNKLHPGAYVLNRHPGKLTRDRKFEIYSGGYVESITEPDEEGNVVAKITHAFTFVTPIKQGSSFLENFEWDSKIKKAKFMVAFLESVWYELNFYEGFLEPCRWSKLCSI
ncbi:MAG: hypothetical protein ACI4U3_03760 [Traorella sp.]